MLVRQVIIIFKKKEISQLLSTVYFEFWPSNILKKKFQQQLKKETAYLVGFCYIFTSSAFISALQYFILPLVLNTGELPFSTSYLFNWSKSPYFELLFVWQSFLCGIFSLSICGFDMLFVSLLWNCIAQFKILKFYIQSDFKNLIQKDKFEKNLFLVKIIRHHQKVVR